MKVVPYTDVGLEAWDAFVEQSWNGTFLHTRRFLSYHGQRFRDASLTVVDDRGQLVGLLPAAVDPADPGTVVSHPGITYGGLVHAGRLQSRQATDAFHAILGHLRAQGFRTLVYKAVPTIYHRLPAEDDRYVLFRLGAERTRCDLSAAIDHAHRPISPSSLTRKLAKARRNGVRIEREPGHLAGYWEILQESLSRHGVPPAHRVDEMAELMRRFPDHIALVTAFLGDDLVAGNVLFITPQTVHAQYGAASDLGRSVAAQDLLDERCIADSATLGKRYFNFGISTEQDGLVLNEGLHRYKTKFGAGGIVHEFFRFRLEAGTTHHSNVGTPILSNAVARKP